MSILVNPILKITADAILSISAKIFKSYNDSIYQRIAQNNSQIEMLAMVWSAIILIFIISGMSVFLIIKSKLIDAEVGSLIQRLKSDDEKQQKSKDDILKELVEAKEQSKKASRLPKIGVIASSIVFILMMIFNFSSEMAIREKILRFSNTIDIIAPYVSENDLKKLKSDFRLIKNESDYNIVITKIERLMMDNGLKVMWISKK
jgi:hypothetical protein